MSGLLDWLRSLWRERDQLTVELAEGGVAPEAEVEATEERVAKHHQPPSTAKDRSEPDR